MGQKTPQPIASGPTPTMASNKEDCDCEYAGAVLGSIFGTLAVVFVIALLIYLIYRIKTKDKRARKELEVDPAHKLNYNVYHEEDTEGAKKAYDNPTYLPEQAVSFAEKGFAGYVPCKEYTSPAREAWLTGQSPKKADDNENQLPKEVIPKQNKSKTMPLLANSTQETSPYSKFGSRQSLDDSFLIWEPESMRIRLQSKDQIGLGFDIKGSMRDGIFISKVLKRGPAVETGKIETGDRIMKMGISFENIVLEDALTIVSYASRYPVELELQKPRNTPKSRMKAAALLENLSHPVHKSQSMDDLRQIELNKKWNSERFEQNESNSSSSSGDEFIPDTSLDANGMVSSMLTTATPSKRSIGQSYSPDPVTDTKVTKRAKNELIIEAYEKLPDEDKKALYRLSYEENNDVQQNEVKSDSDSGTDVQTVTAQVHVDSNGEEEDIVIDVEKSEVVITKATPTRTDIGYFTMNGESKEESQAPLRIDEVKIGTKEEISPNSESDRGTMSSEISPKESPTHSPPVKINYDSQQHVATATGGPAENGLDQVSELSVD